LRVQTRHRSRHFCCERARARESRALRAGEFIGRAPGGTGVFTSRRARRSARRCAVVIG
jgi:hypothetical protein